LKVTKIILGVLIGCGLLTLGGGFYLGNNSKNNEKSYYNEEYTAFFDEVASKGTQTLSLISDLVIPEI